MQMAWPLVAISELGRVITGKTPPTAKSGMFGGSVPFVTPTDLGSDLEPARTVTSAGVAESRLARKGSTLVCCIGTVGKMAIANQDCAFNQQINAVEWRERVLDGFGFFALGRLRSVMQARASSTTLPLLNKSQFSKLEIPLPPIEAQRRIVAVLDKADELRAKRRGALVKLDALVEATFVEMFGDPASTPAPISMTKLSEVGEIITGNTPSRSHPEYFGRAIEWIKSDNIQPPNPYLTHAKEGLSSEGMRVGRVVPSGSILVTCIAGSPSSIGSAAIADRPVAFNQQINALVPHRGEAPYFHALLVAGKKIVQAASTASMKGMISKSRFGSIELPIAPVDLQKQFVQRVSLIHRQRNFMEESARQLNDLFLSSQLRAFQGEL